MPKVDKNKRKKEMYSPIFFMNRDEIILNKILANQIQEPIKKITHHYQVGFIAECKDGSM
jgi:hypothetical protein